MQHVPIRFLNGLALMLALGWLSWAFYDQYLREPSPGLRAFKSGSVAFEDGEYQRALESFEQAIEEAPQEPRGYRGRAITLMQMGQFEAALNSFDEAIALRPEFAGSYANRGILYDRMGRHGKALADYERALTLDAELLDGPDWLTRLLRNQARSPATIKARADYLRQQLALPARERRLSDPEQDRQQRSYRVD